MSPNDIQRTLGRLESKLDAMANTVREIRKMQDDLEENLEPRIRSLEVTRAKFRGIVMAAGTFCGAIGAFVGIGVKELIQHLTKI